ncbi:exosortase E/protease, VPEID-CTERM system [Roseovarius aquimarinus]
MADPAQIEAPPLPLRAVLIPALLLAELVGVALLFQLGTPIECRLTDMAGACRGLRGIAVAAMCFAALFGIYLWASAAARHALLGALQRTERSAFWRAVHLSGAALMLAPLVAIPVAGLNAAFGAVFALLALGGALATLGGLFWLAPPAAWAAWVRGRIGVLGALVFGAALLPMLAEAAGPLWYWQRLTEATFAGVAVLLWLIGEAPMGDPAAQVLGVDGFVVAIADSCSGVEGFALTTAFLALYAWLFRGSLLLGRFWGGLWPAALLLSWLLNVLRIAVLIWIGAHVSPELAVGGFHSFAGWLFFMALALLVLVLASRLAWLHRAPQAAAAATSLSRDSVAALILPFIAFMVSGVVAQTFWQDPALAYPAQAAIMAGALWYVRVPLLGMLGRPSVLSVLAGLGVGALWIAMAEGGGGGPALAGAALAGWIAARLIGTVLLVPLIEEAFFRGYVLQRIAGPRGRDRLRILAGIVVSSALFALLHGRFGMAALAGAVFCAIYLHRRNLGDAVAAHAAANGVIALAALWQGDWSLI